MDTSKQHKHFPASGKSSLVAPSRPILKLRSPKVEPPPVPSIPEPVEVVTLDARLRASIGRLCALFPDAFSLERPRRPLKVGIHHDIRARAPGEFKTGWLYRVLRHYGRSARYLDSLALGAMRVDLDGNPVEPVTEKALAHAAEIRAEHRKRRFVAIQKSRDRKLTPQQLLDRERRRKQKHNRRRNKERARAKARKAEAAAR